MLCSIGVPLGYLTQYNRFRNALFFNIGSKNWSNEIGIIFPFIGMRNRIMEKKICNLSINKGLPIRLHEVILLDSLVIIFLAIGF